MKKAEEVIKSNKKSTSFSDEELAAMKERSKETKAETSRRTKKDQSAEDEQDCLAKIAEMREPDRGMAERIHALIKASAPELAPKTWYGQPAYAKDGKIICFFQPSQKFNTHYSTFGFNDAAHLDDGDMWPVYFALTAVTPAVEARIKELVKKAIS